jgi:hypothetical protein
MLSIAHIARMSESDDWERLIDHILSNGRGDHLAIRLRLSQPHSAGTAATALALQRIVELAYGPAPAAERLARRLVSMQQPDGRFRGMPAAHDLALTTCLHSRDRDGATPAPSGHGAAAAAIRALIEHARRRDESGAPADPVIATAIDRGLHAISAAQRSDGGIGEDSVEDAIILWQLGGCGEFRAAVRYLDFVEVVESPVHPAIDGGVRRLALAAAA